MASKGRTVIMKVHSINQQFNYSRPKLESSSEIPSFKANANVLKSSLMGLSVLGASMLTTSCIMNPPDENSLMYVAQCPYEDLPIKHMDGFTEKADYMMNLIGLLPDGKSIKDLKEINIQKENGDKITITNVDDDYSDGKIEMNYILEQSDGAKDETKMIISDKTDANGFVNCIVSESDNIPYQYINYTQSTYNKNDLYAYIKSNSEDKNCILRKTENGIIKVDSNNNKERMQVNTKF